MFSNIKYINNKYVLELPLIKRKFDNIYINYKKVNSSFWILFNWVFFKNTIFWVSNFWKNKLFYSLDLEKFRESEFLINSLKIFNINIFNKNYSIIILFLVNWKTKILTKIDKKNFNIIIEKWILKVINVELNSIIFEKDISNILFNNFVFWIDKEIKQKYTSILDIYFFNNFFIKSEKLLNFDENIENFIFKNKEFGNLFLPKNKLEIFEKWNLHVKISFIEKISNIFWKNKNKYDKLKLLKTFLQFKNNYDFVLDSIYYEDLKEYFGEFKFKNSYLISSRKKEKLEWFNIQKLNLEKTDWNLENINKQIQDFSLNYYELERNYAKLNKLENNNKNSKILEQNKRLELFKIDLEKLKKQYLEYFKEFLDKIN